ncbi:hypothetical protein ACMV6F_27430, partial [Pseudomonas putida]
VDFFDFAVGAHHAGLAPEGNREHSIGHQVSALNVGFMEHLLLDASIGYDLGQVVLLGVDVRLNANNLTNERYITSCVSLNYCYMGKECNVSATASYQF